MSVPFLCTESTNSVTAKTENIKIVPRLCLPKDKYRRQVLWIAIIIVAGALLHSVQYYLPSITTSSESVNLLMRVSDKEVENK